MDGWLTSTLAWLAVVWAGYVVLTRLAAYAAKPRRVRPAPATPDLPDNTPPAVVGLLVNDCRVDPDAAVATLLDLAARRHLELYQPANDPAQTLVRVRDAAPEGLTPYERRVLDRVVAAADGAGAVSLRDLSGHYAEDGYRWAAEFDREVTADAKARKLLSEAPGGLAALMLVLGALLACGTGSVLPLLVVPIEYGQDDNPSAGATTVYIVAIVLLTTVILVAAVLPLMMGWADRPHRTAAGKALTASWLGVDAWLRGHGSGFTELPPASVTVWDRYLSYGAALGVTPVASRAADLAVGARQVLWSDYSGAWREIRVRYPGRGRRSGYPPMTIIMNSLVLLALLAGLAWLVQSRWHLTGTYALAAALIVSPLVIRSVYRILRAVADRVRPVEYTGRVLTRSTVPYLVGLSDLDTTPRFVTRQMTRARQPYFVVVDDGRSPVTPVWTVYPGWRGGGQCEVGDVVRLRGYRWCRYARWVRVITT